MKLFKAAGLPDGVSTAVKVALVAFTVVAAAAFIALSGGSSAGAVGSVAGTQLTKAILKESARVAVRQLTMQAALIVVMGSGILVEIPQEILKKTGLDESLQNKLSIAILIVEILAVMTVSAKVSASMFDISGRQPATSANQLSTLEKIKQSAKGFQEEINRTIDGMKTSLQSSLNTLRHPLTYIKSLRGKARNLGSAIIDIPKDIIASTMPDVDRTAKAYLRLKAANRLGQITNAATGVVNSAGKMVYQFLIYDVTKGLGDTEEEIARLRALLDAIDETISNFQKDISSDAAIYDSFATSVTKMLRQFTQTTETIFNSQG